MDQLIGGLKILYTGFVGLLIPVYWKEYGPANFLWFSDIALFLLVPAWWLESKLLFSTIAVSVVLLEVIWNVDFFVRLITGKTFVGLSRYMFDGTIRLSIRALSLFHVLLPVIVLCYVYRLGYDSQGLVLQTLIAWVVLPVCYFFTNPRDNVNWVFGLGGKPRTRIPGPGYLLRLMIGFPLVIYVPSHLLLKALFSE